MKTAAATPYLLPAPASILAEGWVLADGAALADRLEHWDAATDLIATRVMTIDLDRVRHDTQLETDAAFAVVASWHATGTRLAGRSLPVEIGTLAGLCSVPVAINVPGEESGARLDLRTRLVIRAAGSTRSPIAPTRPGTVIWSDIHTVVLEGAAGRFPTASQDFRTSPALPDDAAWVIDWDPGDLDAPVLGGMRLLLNSASEAVMAATRSGNTESLGGTVRSFVMYDVARSLVHSALSRESFLAREDAFDPDSVGRMLSDLIGSIWPGIALRTLAGRLADTPGRIDADIQAYLGVLR